MTLFLFCRRATGKVWFIRTVTIILTYNANIFFFQIFYMSILKTIHTLNILYNIRNFVNIFWDVQYSLILQIVALVG